MDEKLRPFLPLVEKPGRYTGGEYNTPDMAKPCNVRFCLCFPDVYEVGMCNVGMSILYNILNGAEGIICERCFAPWKDMAQILRDNGIPLSSIETGKPLRDFDVVGISVPYEMSYTSVLYLLDLAGIPFYAKDRDERYPLIVGGGPSSANPEPVIDFFDVYFIGEGEEIDLAFCRIVEKYKGNRKKILEEAAKIDGIYVPSLCETKDGICVTRVKKAVVDLEKAPFPTKPLVPNIEIVHDRAVVELYRGCYAGCRFCQACFFYRPVRYREKETVSELAERLIQNTGFEELGLISLSSGDYEPVYELLEELQVLNEKQHVSMQLPSLRLDSFSAKLMSEAKKLSLTFAPEAGTQRLRNVINKNITDEDIESSMKLAFSIGYRTVKLYFMSGLPTETDEDILGIAETVRRIRYWYIQTTGRKDISVNVSVAVFIPKPVTPFQWAEQISLEEMKRRQDLLRKELYAIKGVHYAWHGAGMSVFEGIFARGDRTLSKVVETAYKKGCYLDSWTEYFDEEKWWEALRECNVDIAKYTGKRSLSERLPWDFIDFGTTKEYLQKEYEKAISGETTDPCKHKCNGCGANKLGACRLFKKEEPCR